MTSPVMTTGYVRTLDPFTVEIPGVDAVAQPCQRNAPAEVGMRGRVDIVDGSRSWAGEWNTDGVPTVVRDGLASVSERIVDMAEVSNGTAQSLSGFEVQYTTDQAAAAVELDAIRGSVAGIELTAVTTNRLAVLATGDGAYMDPGFLDPALTQERADNSGLGRVDNEIFGTGTFYLSQRGADEGVSLPLQVDSLYSVVVKGDNLTADRRVVAVKWGNGVVTNLPTVYSTDGSLTSMAASVVPTSAGARLLVRAVAGAPMMTVRSVSIRRGIGGTLMEEDSINTTHITTDAVKARHVDTSEVYADLKIVSPNIETNLAADRGLKMIGDRLTGYSPTGQLQIDVGGPEGLIKGVALEGVSVNGGSFKTNAGTDGYVDIRSYGASHSVKAVGTAGRTAFSLSGVTGPEEYGIMQLFSDVQGRELHATAYMLAFRDSNGTGQATLEIQNNAIGPAIRSYKKPLYLSSGHGIYINQVDVAGREVETLSSHLTLVRQGRIREVICDTTVALANGANVTIFGTVPEADRPPSSHATGTVYVDGGWMPGAVVTPVGAFIIVNRTGQALNARTQGRVSWTI